MVFSSNTFLFAFLPAVLVVYYSAPARTKNIVLLVFSLLFYAWGEPVHLWIMAAVIIGNYIFGMLIGSYSKDIRQKKIFLVLSVVLNLGLLGYYKYAGFLTENLSRLPLFGGMTPIEIALPIGISFFIFQSMSYTIDVYRGDTGVQKNPFVFGTYVALFPQLIAGPIVRYRDVEEQLTGREHSFNSFASGVGRFIIGLGKKVLIANQMGSMCSALEHSGGSLSAWAYMLAFSLQIYFDFSGYSDMAIGLGRMFGFEFLENFNYPYISKSVTEFWRRWHISLSTWFKEYVYIPLGGNRCGKGRQIINLLIVWTLTGFWHGANWNFMLWGLYYALLLIAEKLFMLKLLNRLPAVLSRCVVLFAVAIGWMLFNFESLPELGRFIIRLFSFDGSSTHELNTVAAYIPVMAAGVIGSTPLVKNCCEKMKASGTAQVIIDLLIAVIFVLSVASITAGGFNPFIYFRF